MRLPRRSAPRNDILIIILSPVNYNPSSRKLLFFLRFAFSTLPLSFFSLFDSVYYFAFLASLAFRSFSHKLKEDCAGTGAVVKIEKNNLLPCSKIQRSAGKRDRQGRPQE